MAVRRIVTNIRTPNVAELRDFYAALFDLNVVMDQGWIATLASENSGPVQISVASEGGSGTEVPDMSIEVDDVDEIHDRAAKFGAAIPYPLTNEPWGVRRFYLTDPAGKLVNVLQHLP